MARYTIRRGKKARRGPLRPAAFALMLACTSCVPAAREMPLLALAAEAPPPPLPEAEAPPPAADPLDLAPVDPADALAANAAIPLADALNPAARPWLHRPLGAMNGQRALLCLAQAVYYEARSESEEGQRAVAQVVLNRVRHPSWPNSVCGVVYQGPMRAGGGCQFSFTCDGALAAAPAGYSWARARRIAADALAGKVFAPAGLATHYHANYVLPHWAPKLWKSAVIGTHIFYRTPGAWGGPGAFSQAYARAEPVPMPAVQPAPAPVPIGLAAVPLPSTPAAAPVAAAAHPVPHHPAAIPPEPKWTANDLPDSQIREQWRHSGQWRADAPAPQPAR